MTIDYTSTRSILESYFNGTEPVKRQNPQRWETDYFFIRGKDGNNEEMEEVDIPNGVNPVDFKNAGYQVPETPPPAFAPTPAMTSALTGTKTRPPFHTADSSRPIADNSQYSLSQPGSFLSDISSGDYRTRVSDVAPNWGDGSEADIRDALAEGKFSQEPASGSALIAPWNDFFKNYEQMRYNKTIGGDKVAHCTANYNSANRGLYGTGVAFLTSTGRELIDSYNKGFDVQDSSDDWAANMQGMRGAWQGKTVQKACPPNPRLYLKDKF